MVDPTWNLPSQCLTKDKLFVINGRPLLTQIYMYIVHADEKIEKSFQELVQRAGIIPKLSSDMYLDKK